MEYTLHITGQCGGCGRDMIERISWENMPRELRTRIRKNFAQDRARGLCPTCYSGQYRAGTLDAVRKTIPNGTFVDEYLSMKSYGESEYSIRQTLGMSEAAFKKAIERAKKRGDL